MHHLKFMEHGKVLMPGTCKIENKDISSLLKIMSTTSYLATRFMGSMEVELKLIYSPLDIMAFAEEIQNVAIQGGDEPVEQMDQMRKLFSKHLKHSIQDIIDMEADHALFSIRKIWMHGHKFPNIEIVNDSDAWMKVQVHEGEELIVLFYFQTTPEGSMNCQVC